MLEVARADPRDPGPRALLEASHALMASLFPAEDNHYLAIDDLAAPGIHFFAAREGDVTLGTGALAERKGYGEIKSMFTAPEARCKGVAAAILTRLEAKARTLGLGRICLETGDSLHAAHTLYERHGFARCGPFGDYTESSTSVFMKKRL